MPVQACSQLAPTDRPQSAPKVSLYTMSTIHDNFMNPQDKYVVETVSRSNPGNNHLVQGSKCVKVCLKQRGEIMHFVILFSLNLDVNFNKLQQ
jgi:hypothetical protein